MVRRVIYCVILFCLLTLVSVLPLAAQGDQFQIAFGDTVSDGVPGPGAGNIEVGGATDAYTFQGTTGDEIIIDALVGTNGQFRWNLRAPDGTELFDVINVDRRALLPQTGTYVFTVRGSQATTTGVYSFGLLLVPPPQLFAVSIGDTIANGVPTAGAGNLEVPGAVDLYTFAGLAGGGVIFDALVGNTGLARVILTAPDGTQLFNGFYLDQQAAFSQTGTYTLRVEGLNVTSTGTYSFQLLNVAPTQTFAIRIGDTVSDGVPAAGAGNLEAQGAVDIYNFDGAAGQVMIFDALVGNTGLFRVTLAAPDGTEVFDQFYQDNQVTLLQTGTYSLRVSGSLVTSFGTYSFQLLNVPPAAQEFTISIGDTVSDGIPETGAGNLEVPGAVDSYAFDALAGQDVIFDALVGDTGQFRLILTAPDGTELFNDFYQDQQVTLPQSGIYNLRVTGGFVALFGTYSFQLLSVPPTAQAFTISVGDTVSDGVPEAGAGNLEVPGAVDIYRFAGTTGQNVIFDALVGDTGQFRVILTAPDGTVLFDTFYIDQQVSLPQTGIYSLTVQGLLVTDFGVYSFALTEVLNSSPVAVDDNTITDEDEAVIIAVVVNDADIDGDALVVSEVTQPANGVAVNNGDDVTYTPNANFNGTDTFTYTVSDGNGGTDTATVTVIVNAVNDDPVAVDDAVETDEDIAVTIAVLVNDTDIDGDALVVSDVTQSANGTVVNNGDDVTYTPNANFNGTNAFTYTVSDNNGGTATATVNVTINAVNDAPVAVDDTAETDEDAAVTINVLANDTDIDGDALVVSEVTQSANGTVVNNSNAVTYTPNANFNGTDTFTYTVSDGNGVTDTATVTITVNPVNDDPQAVDDEATTDEDSPVTINVLSNDTDVDGDPLAITDVSLPANGTVTLNPNDTITYSPFPNFNGTDSFEYDLTDGQGGNSSAVVTITITPVNDAPEAASDEAATNEDTPVAIAVLANDIDVDGDTLTVESVTQPTNGSAVLNPDGTVTYMPNLDFNGTDSFSYTVIDGNGGSATTTVTVNVGEGNDSPVAIDDDAETDEDEAVSIDVLANDTDPEGDALAVSDVTQPANGVVVNNGDDVIYTPNADFNGTDSFSYRVSDGVSADTATVTITVNPVNDDPVLDISTDPIETDEGQPVSRTFTVNDVDGDVLTGTASSGTLDDLGAGSFRWSDPADDGPSTFTVVISVSDGQGGQAEASFDVVVNNVAPTTSFTNESGTITAPGVAQLTFSAEADPSQADTDAGFLYSYDCVSSNPEPQPDDFTLAQSTSPTFNCPYATPGTYLARGRIADKDGGFTDQYAEVVVEGALNNAPDANDDTASTSEDTMATIAVLANDTDADGGTLTVTAVTQPANGTAFNNFTDVIYLPNANFDGTDSFTYTASDGNGGTDTATVIVTVNAVNDAPIANDDSAATDENVAITIAVLANDSDVDGDALTVGEVTQPTNGSVTNNGGSISYTPNGGFTGPDSFTYTASDGSGGTDTAVVTITVNPTGTPGDFTIERQIDQSLDDVNEDGALFTRTSTSVWIGTGASIDQSYLGLRFNDLAIPAGATIDEAYLQVFTPANTWIYLRVEFAAEATANSQSFSPKNRPSQRLLTDARVSHRSNVLWQGGTWIAFEGLSSVVQEVVDQPGWQNGNSLSLIIRGTGSQWARKFVTSYDDNPALAPKLIVRFSAAGDNVPPVASNDEANTAEDIQVSIPVLSNDSDADGDAIQITEVTQPANGTAFNNLTDVIYLPNTNFNGTDSFTYTITDGQGGTAVATVTVNIAPVNDAPAAADDTASTSEGQTVNIDILANDSDVDGDGLVIDSVTQPANGSVTIDGSSINYTPAAGFSGMETFAYTVADGSGGTAMATVSVNVSAPEPEEAPIENTTPTEDPIETPPVTEDPTEEATETPSEEAVQPLPAEPQPEIEEASPVPSEEPPTEEQEAQAEANLPEENGEVSE